MEKISLCAIMKNEANNIEDFVLCHSPYVDEIVLIDNGSTDNSINLARSLNVKVLSSNENFDLARNVYIENASYDWILVLDLDEVMLPDDIINLKNKLSLISKEVGSVIIPGYQYYGGGKWATWYLPRVIRKDKNMKYDSSIHGSVSDSVEKSQKRMGYIYAAFHHFDGIISSDRNISKRKRNIPLLSSGLKESPQNIKLLMALASEYISIGNKVGALEVARQAVELDLSGKKRACQRLAAILYSLGEYEEAIKNSEIQIEQYNQEIEKVSPRSLRFRKQIDACKVIIAKCYIKMGDIKRGEEIFMKNIYENPELAHNYYNLYLLSPDNRKEMLEVAERLNPLLKSEKVFGIKTEYTLYELTSSII